MRRGDLLYVSMHLPDRDRPYRRDMRIDPLWLDQVLRENADARYKFVAGHYPVFPVNGFTQHPLWCLHPEERQPFWDVLRRHQVTAYLGSHIIAFDVQVHDGIPQIISGGAGTYTLMPPHSEYFHAVQMAVCRRGLRYRVLDTAGRPRESLVWPFELPPSDQWPAITPENVVATMPPAAASGIVAWRFRGRLREDAAGSPPQTLLIGWDAMEGPAAVWIGIEGYPSKLVVRVVPQAGYGWQTWTGPELSAGHSFDLQVALHRGMGPGGVLWRQGDDSDWSSLSCSSAKGAEDLVWPPRWAIGHAQSNQTEMAFNGSSLRVSGISTPLPESV